MSIYAADTSTSVEKTRAEIEATLRRFKADGFAYATEGRHAMIEFKAAGKRVRFSLELPDPAEKRFTHRERIIRGYSHGFVPRKPEAVNEVWEQECRSKWRALFIAIKGKLVAIDAGISTFEQEFMAHIVLPGGGTVGETVIPLMNEAYSTGTVPSFLRLTGGR